jgi:hypothetical protein
MQIPSETIIEHVNERIMQLAMQCIGDKNRNELETQYDRGRYAAYRELTNWITTNYSYDE